MNYYDILCYCSLTFNAIQFVLMVMCVLFFAGLNSQKPAEVLQQNVSYTITYKRNGRIFASGFTSLEEAMDYLENYFGKQFLKSVLNNYDFVSNYSYGPKIKQYYAAVYDRIESRN